MGEISCKTNVSIDGFPEIHNTKKCSFCGAEEGKIRIVGDFIVSLTPVPVEGKVKMACQSCSRKHWDLRSSYLRKSSNGRDYSFRLLKRKKKRPNTK